MTCQMTRRFKNKYLPKKLFFSEILILIRLFWPHPVEGGGGKWCALKSVHFRLAVNGAGLLVWGIAS